MAIEAITAVEVDRFYGVAGSKWAQLSFTGPSMANRVIVAQQDFGAGWVNKWFGAILTIRCQTEESATWLLDGVKTRVRVEESDGSDESPWYYPDITEPTPVTTGTASSVRVLLNEFNRFQVEVNFAGVPADYAYPEEHEIQILKYFYPLGGTPGVRTIFHSTVKEMVLFDGMYFADQGIFTPFPCSFRNNELEDFEWWGGDGTIKRFADKDSPAYPLDPIDTASVAWYDFAGDLSRTVLGMAPWPAGTDAWPVQEGDTLRVIIKTKFLGGALQGERQFLVTLESLQSPNVAPNQSFSGVIGQPVNFIIDGAGSAWSADVLPPGLSISGATVSGVPTTAGSTVSTITVSNSLGSANGTVEFLITSRAASGVPVIGAGAAGSWDRTLTQFRQFAMTVGATNSPTAWVANGLPPGLSINAAGLISGAPTAEGLYVAALQAENSFGLSEPVYISFVVEAAAGSATSAALAKDLQWDILTGSVTVLEGGSLSWKRGDTAQVIVRVVKGERTIAPEWGDTGTLRATVRPKDDPLADPIATATATNPTAQTGGGYLLDLTWTADDGMGELEAAVIGDLEFQISTEAGQVVSSQNVEATLLPDITR